MMGFPKLGPVIAIDGPAGTGKSTVTKRISDALGFTHVDTGALYRCIGFLMLGRGYVLAPDAPVATEVEQEASDLAHAAHIEFRHEPGLRPSNRVCVNGDDVTDKIRTPEVSLAASRVSAIPGVRAALLGLQRRLGCQGKAVLEGRDIGTVIFPDADVKFFLTASVDERAKRRMLELQQSGTPVPSFEELKKQTIARDHADSTRAIAPLKKAEDAVEIDTTSLSLDQVVEKMVAIVRERLKL